MRKAQKTDEFYKEEPDHKIWWLENPGEIGPLEFSFDKKTVYNYWPDFPDKLTKEQLELFCKENPYWAEFRGIKVDK